ncbi:MAG: hypothetical protein K2J20_05905 [Bacilli bacterium]|nr:hypothetical protein [Bacilli bacterium]
MKKTKFCLFVSIFELIVGLLAVGSFVLIVIDVNENAMKWIGTLLLSLVFIIMGIIGIIDYNKNKKN